MRKILITGFNGNLGKRIFNHQQNLPFYCIFLSKNKCCNHISRINKHVIADLSKDDLDDQLWEQMKFFIWLDQRMKENKKSIILTILKLPRD